MTMLILILMRAVDRLQLTTLEAQVAMKMMIRAIVRKGDRVRGKEKEEERMVEKGRNRERDKGMRRERKREREIYIYIDRERERERKRDVYIERDSQRDV